MPCVPHFYFYAQRSFVDRLTDRLFVDAIPILLHLPFSHAQLMSFFQLQIGLSYLPSFNSSIWTQFSHTILKNRLSY